MKYAWLYLPGIAIILFSVIGSVIQARSREKREKMSGFVKKSRDVHRALDMKTPMAVQRFMEEYALLYQMAEPVLDPDWKETYRLDIKELEDHLKDLEWRDWHKRAAPHLQNFIDCYDSLRHDSLTPQKAMEIKRKCIREWQAYYGVQLDNYHTRITPKKYFRNHLGEDYDECMDDHYKLERQLDRFIRQNKT